MARIPTPQPGPLRPAQLPTNSLKKPTVTSKDEIYKTFSETLKDFVGDVNTLQAESGKTVERFLTGEVENAHDVMVAVEKAGISFELMMEIRNKMIEGYNEIMRMQV